MNASAVENTILSISTEDEFGLYEAIWKLNEAFPGASLGEKYDAAAKAILELFRKNQIQLMRRRESGLEQDCEAETISAIEEARSLLSNPVSWYPTYDGKRVVFFATTKGKRSYSES